MKVLNRVEVSVTNMIVILLIVGLQFLYYGFAPSINHNIVYKDNFDKRAACIQATMSFNKTLIVELILGTIIISIFNYNYFREVSQSPIKITAIAGLIFILIAGLALTFFTIDYIDRNMAT